MFLQPLANWMPYWVAPPFGSMQEMLLSTTFWALLKEIM